ncbi:cupin domain-containing protein [Methylacidiphilales bacterium]|nr:cupin domain-containing protein [Candidatus Methylacidiphilales bacterium]
MTTAVKIKTLLKTSLNSGGQKIAYPRGGRAELTALYIEIAPGQETGWHKHPVPHFGYILSGSITVEGADGKKRTYRQGDAAAETVNLLHNGVNRGKKPVKILVFVAGKKNIPITIKAKQPSSRAEVSRKGSFATKAIRTAVEGYSRDYRKVKKVAERAGST